MNMNVSLNSFNLFDQVNMNNNNSVENTKIIYNNGMVGCELCLYSPHIDKCQITRAKCY